MSNCCPECFTDDWLKNHIKENGEEGHCDFCDENRESCIETDDLIDIFEPVLSLYTPVDQFVSQAEIKDMDDGDLIWEILSYDWDIFYDSERAEDILRDMFPSHPIKDEEPIVLIDSWYGSKSDYFGNTDETSDKLISLWDKFCEEIKYSKRFFPENPLADPNFKDVLISLDYTIQPLEPLYRARISNVNKFDCSDMGKPPKENSANGRANPIGISCLYLANNIDTAISEIRPDIHDYVTIGNFGSLKNMKLLDLRNNIRIHPFKHGWDLAYILDSVKFFKKLGEELSKPINNMASDIEYVPTQYLSEYIKIHLQYDGIMYSSSVSDGYNVALFNDNESNIACSKTELYQISSVDFNYEYNNVVRASGSITPSGKLTAKIIKSP